MVWGVGLEGVRMLSGGSGEVVWKVLGGYLECGEAVCMVLGHCVIGVRRLSGVWGGFLEGLGRLSVGCQVGVWRVLGVCLKGVGRVSGSFLEGVGRFSGGCEDVVWRV